jgi:hypothetical protein
VGHRPLTKSASDHDLLPRSSPPRHLPREVGRRSPECEFIQQFCTESRFSCQKNSQQGGLVCSLLSVVPTDNGPRTTDNSSPASFSRKKFWRRACFLSDNCLMNPIFLQLLIKGRIGNPQGSGRLSLVALTALQGLNNGCPLNLLEGPSNETVHFSVPRPCIR